LKNNLKWILLFVAVLFPVLVFAGPGSIGPLRPETPVPGIHPTSWTGRYKLVEAIVEHIRKAYRDTFEQLNDAQKECLRAQIAYDQAKMYQKWIDKDLNPSYWAQEGLSVEFHRKNMLDKCGGGGGNPAVELYRVYTKEHGPKSIVDLVKKVEANPNAFKPIDLTSLNRTDVKEAHEAMGKPSYWAAVKYAFTVYIGSQIVMQEVGLKLTFKSWKKIIAEAETDPETQAALMTAGLIVLAVGAPVLVF
jgi:hypothetical protein